MNFELSSDAVAGLLGAAIGAVVTLSVTGLTRWWANRDYRSAGRKAFTAQSSERLKAIIAARTESEIDRLADQTFESSAAAVHVPRGETAVVLWRVFHERAVIATARLHLRGDLSEEQRKAVRQLVFDQSLDLQHSLTEWTRGSFTRTRAWFWLQLRTTYRPEWRFAKKLARENGAEEKAWLKLMRRRRKDATPFAYPIPKGPWARSMAESHHNAEQRTPKNEASDG